MPNASTGLKETQIRNAIFSWLSLHGAVPVIHDNVGIYDKSIGGYRARNNVRRIKGVSDILVCWRGRYVAVEVKSAKGRLSPYQMAFLSSVNQAQGVAIVARSIEDVERELKAHGLYP